MIQLCIENSIEQIPLFDFILGKDEEIICKYKDPFLHTLKKKSVSPNLPNNLKYQKIHGNQDFADGCVFSREQQII